jgi:hypothetical protein
MIYACLFPKSFIILAFYVCNSLLCIVWARRLVSVFCMCILNCVSTVEKTAFFSLTCLDTFFFIDLLIGYKVTLCSLGCPQTHDPLTSAFWVLRLKISTTTPGSVFFFKSIDHKCKAEFYLIDLYVCL